MISHQFAVAFQGGHVSNVPPHFSHPKPQVSSEIRVTNREPLHESLCISVTASESLKDVRGLHRKGLAEREEKERIISFERAHKQSLDSEKERARHFEQQHSNTCHTGHFHHARWRIPTQEYVLASETCPHNKDKAFSQEVRLLACA